MKKADTNLEALLNKNNYQEKDLFTLKIPINLPYQTSHTNFERVDGEITVNNETYKFVQRKVENDTLYLQCIRHTEKMNLEQKGNDYFGKINDISVNDQNAKDTGKHLSITKYSLQDFIDSFTSWNLNALKPLTIPFLIKPFTINGLGHLQHQIKPPIFA